MTSRRHRPSVTPAPTTAPPEPPRVPLTWVRDKWNDAQHLRCDRRRHYRRVYAVAAVLRPLLRRIE